MDRPEDHSRKALAFLARLAAEFVAVLSLPDLLQRVAQLLSEETDFDSCSIALIEAQDPELLVIRATAGPIARAVGQTFRRPQGLGWTAIESGKPILIPDRLSDPRTLHPSILLRSAIMAPLTVNGKAIGVIAAHRAEPHAFSATDLDLLSVVARYLAGAIEVGRLHAQMTELASTDALTGLANRRVFFERLRGEIERGRRTSGEVSVALLDLDNFKGINDVHGHAEGDALLVRIATVFAGGIRAYDLAGRLGGDEFALMFPQTPPHLADEVIRRFPAPQISGSGLPTTVGFCWGIAAWPPDGDDVEHLMRVADDRLYTMKRTRRSPGGADDGPENGVPEASAAS